MPKTPSKREAKKATDPPHLPGMFYGMRVLGDMETSSLTIVLDKEKRKYFAIRNTNDPSVPYSTGYIKALKAREEREHLEESRAKRKVGLVKQSKILEHPLAGGLLLRACGVGRENKIDAPAIHANGLDREDFIRKGTISSNRPMEPSMFVIIPKSDSDSLFGDVYAAAENGFMTSSWMRDGEEIGQETHFPSGISTSISHNASTKQICATWLSGIANSGIAILSEITHQRDLIQTGFPFLLFGPGFSRGSGEVDVYSSVAAPESSSYVFIVGTSHGLLGIDKTQHDASYITPQTNIYGLEFAPKDTFALDFLPDNPSILLSGGRRGYLNITDLRVPQYGDNADIIYHPSSITHIKAIDCHRIVVAGMQSHLCQYDLRYRKVYDTNPPRALFSCRDDPRITLPIVTYPEYHNEASQFLGFDVDIESGIIAAAQENTNHHAIRLFDLHGGHALESPLLTPPLPAQPVEAPVRCLRFVDDRDGGAKSLWLAQPKHIHRYYWS